MKLYCLPCRAYFLVVLVSSSLVVYSAPSESQTNEKDNIPGDQRDGNQADETATSLSPPITKAAVQTVTPLTVDLKKQKDDSVRSNSSGVPSGKSSERVVKTSNHKPPPVEVKPLSSDYKVQLYQVEKATVALSLSKISTILLSTSEDVFPNALADALNYDLNDPKLRVIEDNRETLFRLLWHRLQERPLSLNPVNNNQNVPTHVEDKNVPDLKAPVEQPNNKAIEADNKLHNDIMERMTSDIRTLNYQETFELVGMEPSKIIDVFVAKFNIEDPQYIQELERLGGERVKEVLTRYLSYEDDEDKDRYGYDMTNDDLLSDRDSRVKQTPMHEDDTNPIGKVPGLQNDLEPQRVEDNISELQNKKSEPEEEYLPVSKHDRVYTWHTRVYTWHNDNNESHRSWHFLMFFVIFGVIVIVGYLWMNSGKKIDPKNVRVSYVPSNTFK